MNSSSHSGEYCFSLGCQTTLKSFMPMMTVTDPQSLFLKSFMRTVLLIPSPFSKGDKSIFAVPIMSEISSFS